MRAVLEERLPAVRIEGGTAEAMPSADGSVDAVVVGNAFHHFERRSAFAEIHRVLHPGGVLALFWAWALEEEELAIPGMREIDEVVEAVRASNEIATAYRSWAEVPDTAEGFGPFERREFRVTHDITAARLADLYATSSDVASMPEPVRRVLLDRVRRLSRELPETCTSREERWSISASAAEQRRVPRGRGNGRERVRGIEPPFRAWEARVLPLNHTRVAPPEGGEATV